MIVLLHVIIAISSIALASFTFFKPSTKKLLVSYGFMIATVGSGTYLLLATGADMLKTCLSGLAYLTITLFITIATHYKMRRAIKEEL